MKISVWCIVFMQIHMEDRMKEWGPACRARVSLLPLFKAGESNRLGKNRWLPMMACQHLPLGGIRGRLSLVEAENS